MASSQTGVHLPPYTFVSHDAVLWLKNNVEFQVTGELEAMERACTLMQHMLTRDFVQRATNQDDTATRRLFIFGYYLYAFVVPDEQAVLSARAVSSQSVAPTNWGPRRIIEMEFVVNNRRLNTAHKRLDTACERDDTDDEEDMRNVTIDVDRDVHKIDRVEWLNLRFSRFYNPACAFQMELRWLVASGSVLGDLITLWSNRAAPNGLCLMLMPVHLMADDDERNRTDPLSSPVFLPVNMTVLDDVLLDGQRPTNDTLRDDSFWDGVRALQTAVLRRCGFLPVGYKPTREQYDGAAAGLSFVHCSGYAWLCISCSQELGPSKTGFFWFWNYMSVRRVHSQEQYKEQLMSNFKALCDGEDGRLRDICLAALKRNAAEDEECLSSCAVNLPADGKNAD